jgi:hypothetical protein
MVDIVKKSFEKERKYTLQEELQILRSLEHGKLPISSFQGGLCKANGYVDEFTQLIRETTFDKCLYANGKSRGKQLQFLS